MKSRKIWRIYVLQIKSNLRFSTIFTLLAEYGCVNWRDWIMVWLKGVVSSFNMSLDLPEGLTKNTATPGRIDSYLF